MLGHRMQCWGFSVQKYRDYTQLLQIFFVFVLLLPYGFLLRQTDVMSSASIQLQTPDPGPGFSVSILVCKASNKSSFGSFTGVSV